MSLIIVLFNEYPILFARLTNIVRGVILFCNVEIPISNETNYIFSAWFVVYVCHFVIDIPFFNMMLERTARRIALLRS